VSERGERRLLGKAFAHEVRGLVWQPKPSGSLAALVAAGKVEHVERQEGPLVVRYHRLTPLGHMSYCMGCKP
jgi:hypothetical protein